LGERGAPDERRPHDEVQLLGVVLDEERRADEQGGRAMRSPITCQLTPTTPPMAS